MYASANVEYESTRCSCWEKGDVRRRARYMVPLRSYLHCRIAESLLTLCLLVIEINVFFIKPLVFANASRIVCIYLASMYM